MGIFDDLIPANTSPVPVPRPSGPRPAVPAPQPGLFADLIPEAIPMSLAADRARRMARGVGEVGAGTLEGLAVLQTAVDQGFRDSATIHNQRDRDQLATMQEQMERLGPQIGEAGRANLQREIDHLAGRIQKFESVEDVTGELQTPDQRQIFKDASTLRGIVEDTAGAPNPARDNEFWGKVFEAGGNAVGFAATGLVGRGVAVAGAGAGMNSGSIYKEAKQSGASEDQAMEAAGLGALIGASEAIPIMTALKPLTQRLPKVGSAILNRLGRVARSAGEEAAQEAGANIMNNLVAQGIYDPERGFSDGVDEAALIGLIVGGGLSATAETADAATRRRPSDPNLIQEAPPAAAEPNPTPTVDSPPSGVPALVPGGGGLPAPDQPQITPDIVPQEALPSVAQPQPDPVAAQPSAGSIVIDEVTVGPGGDRIATGNKVIYDPETKSVQPAPPDAQLGPVEAPQAPAQPQPAPVAPQAPIAAPEALGGAPVPQEQLTAPVETAIVPDAPQTPAAPKTPTPVGRPGSVRPPPRHPLIGQIKGLGGIDPASKAGQELKSRGINARTAPGLFRKGGLKDVDNLPASEWQGISDQIGVEGDYLSRQGTLDAIEREFRGDPVWDADQRAAADALGQKENLYDEVTRVLNDEIGAADTLTPIEIDQVVADVYDGGIEIEDAIWWRLSQDIERSEAADAADDAPYIPFPGPEEGPGSEGESAGAGDTAPASIAQPEVVQPTETPGAEIPAPAESVVEPGPDGGEQLVIPGAEAISQGEQAQRAQDEPLKPNAEQKAPGSDGGLFDNNTQTDMFDGPIQTQEDAQAAIQKQLEGIKGTPQSRDFSKSTSNEAGNLKGPQPNKHGVYDDDDVKPEDHLEIDLKKKGSASIDVLEVDGEWLYASSYDVTGSSGGGNGLSTTHKAGSRDEAIAKAMAQLRRSTAYDAAGLGQGNTVAPAKAIYDWANENDPTGRTPLEESPTNMQGGTVKEQRARLAQKDEETFTPEGGNPIVAGELAAKDGDPRTPPKGLTKFQTENWLKGYDEASKPKPKVFNGVTYMPSVPDWQQQFVSEVVQGLPFSKDMELTVLGPDDKGSAGQQKSFKAGSFGYASFPDGMDGNKVEIALNPGRDKGKIRQLETLAHELGHVAEFHLFNQAPKKTQDAIRAEFAKISAKDPITVGEAKDQMANRKGRERAIGAADSQVIANPFAQEGWNEWFADQVASALQASKPAENVVQKFWNRLAQVWRKLAKALHDSGKPRGEVRKWLDSIQTWEPQGPSREETKPTAEPKEKADPDKSLIDDIPYQAAYEAYRNMSHSPERRAKSARESYVSEINTYRAELEKVAKEPDQKAMVEGEVQEYRQGYRKRMLAMLAASSRTASAMITGPANFPTRQNQKRLNAYDKRMGELLDYAKKQKSRAVARINNALSAEAKIENEWASVRKNVLKSLHNIDEIQSGKSPGFDVSLFKSNLAGRMKTLAKSGNIEMVNRALELIRETQAKYAKPAFTARHSIWKLGEQAEAAKAKDAERQGADEVGILDTEGLRIEEHPADDRLRMFFDGKPAPEILAALKSSGWKWSRANEAWQRQLTNNARHSAQKIASEFGFNEGDQAFAETSNLFTHDVTGQSFSVPRPATMDFLMQRHKPLLARLKRGFQRDAVMGQLSRLRIQLQDMYLPLRRAEQTIEASLGRPLDDDASGYIKEGLMRGKMEAQAVKIESLYQEPIINLMADNNLDMVAVDDFLTSRHAEERNRVIKDRTGNDNGSGLDMAEINDLTDGVKSRPLEQIEALEEIGRLFDQMNRDMVEFRVEKGLMTQDQATEWLDMYQHYAPLRGFNDLPDLDDGRQLHDFPVGTSSFSVRGPESQKAEGRGKVGRAPDVLATAFSLVHEAIIRGHRNEAGGAFIRMVQQHPDKAWEVVSKKPKLVYNKDTGQTEYRMLFPTLTDNQKKEHVEAKIDGKPVLVKINNPDLARAMNRLGIDRASLIVRIFAPITRFIASTHTRWNLPFILKNMVRDAQSGLLTLQKFEDEPGLTKDVMRDYFSALRSGLQSGRSIKEHGKLGKWYKEFVTDGAQTAYFQFDTVSDKLIKLRRELKTKGKGPGGMTWRTLRGIGDAIEALNNATENALRLALYKNLRERGHSREQAAMAAKNITTNFNRRGEWTYGLNSMFMFANAAVQGSHTIINAMYHSKTVRRNTVGLIVFGMMIDMLNAHLDGDEDTDEPEDWDELPEHIRARNIALITKDQDRVTIPLAYGWSAFFAAGSNINAMIRHLSFGEGHGRSVGDAFLSTLNEAIASFSPLAPSYGTVEDFGLSFAPSATRPMVEAYVNRNPFFGGKVFHDNSYGQGTLAHQSSVSTSPAGEAIAKGLNAVTGGDESVSGGLDIHPKQLDHLFFGYLGSMARTTDQFQKIVRSMYDDRVIVDGNQVPFAKDFFKEETGWEYMSKANDRAQDVRQMVDFLAGAMRRGKTEKAAEIMAANGNLVRLMVSQERLKKWREGDVPRNPSYKGYKGTPLGKYTSATKAAFELYNVAHETMTGDAKRKALDKVQADLKNAGKTFSAAYIKAIKADGR